jgi:predicted DNA-binding transcriptional regulator YafY
MRNRSLVQQLQFVRRLESRRGHTVAELAAEFHITKRTVYRQLAAIEEAGFPLVDVDIDGAPAKRWRLLDWRKEVA